MRGISRYILGRLIAVVPQLVGVSFVAFVLIRLLPGDPAALNLTDGQPDNGCEHPAKHGSRSTAFYTVRDLYQACSAWRFWYVMVYGATCREGSRRRAPASLELVVLAMMVATLVGVAVGVACAVKPRGIFARTAIWYMRLAGSFPDFWLALVSVYVFFFLLRIFPPPLGRLDISLDPPTHVTGSYVIDSLLAWNSPDLRSALAHLALPVFFLGFVVAPIVAKVTATTMTEVMRSDFIRYAQALGHSRRTIWRYALRNAAPPIVTIGGIFVADLLGGLAIEKVFAWGGAGEYAVQSVNNADYSAIQGFLFFASVFTAGAYLS